MRKTLLDVAKSVCGELSFQVPVALMSSNDLLFQQVRYLAAAACEELLYETDWQSLQKTGSITLTGAESYALPTDMDRIIPGTFTYTVGGQLQTTDVQGSVSAQTFNNLGNTVSMNTIQLQIVGDRLFIYPSTLASGAIKFSYVSANFISDSSGTEWKSVFTQDSDIPVFNSRLVVAATKLKLLQTKGLDTTAATVDYNIALELAKKRDVPAPLLSFDQETHFNKIPNYVVIE